MIALPTRIELADGERFLLPFHKPTAQRVIDAWNAAFLADIECRKAVYKAACAATPDAAHVWAMTERYWQAEQAGDAEMMAEIDRETGAYVETHAHIFEVFLDIFDSEQILSTEDLAAAYQCLWGDE